MTPRNVVLIGAMGAGKTTVGAALARRLDYALVDTDALVVEATGRSVEEIWADQGEAGFRAHEHDAVVRACAGSSRVIACGGGAILQITNYGVLKGAGTVVYLRADGGALWDRVSVDGGRPLATDRDSFVRLVASRAPAYEAAADVVIDVGGREPDQIAADLEALLT